MLKSHKIQQIKYTKDNGEVTERYVIPTFVPKPNVKAIDVTQLDEDTRNQLLSLLVEYNNYVAAQTNTIFGFEEWVEHTKLLYVEPTWRTFKINNTEVL